MTAHGSRLRRTAALLAASIALAPTATGASVTSIPAPSRVVGPALPGIPLDSLELTPGGDTRSHADAHVRWRSTPNSSPDSPFLTPTGVPLPGDPEGFVVAEVSGDGYPDVVLAFPDGSLQRATGSPGEGLASPVVLATGLPLLPGYRTDYARLLPMVCVDLDGDGRRDLALLGGSASAPGLLLLRNLGAGGFSTLASLPLPGLGHLLAAADLDRDGDADLLTERPGGGGLLMFRNSGGGAFDPPVTVAGPGSLISFVVADLTGDGAPEVAATRGPGDATWPVIVWRNDGFGGLEALPDLPFTFISVGIAAADFDRDGTTDLALGGQSALRILDGSGDGTFGAPEPWAIPICPPQVLYLTAADATGDGDIDLAYGSGLWSPIDVVLPNVAGGFPGMTSYDAASRYGKVGVADFDRDGRPDLVGLGYGQFDLLRGLGPARYTGRQVVLTLASSPNWLAVADLDEDRRLDIVDVDYGHPSLQVHLQKAPGAFANLPGQSLPDTWGEIVEAVDFDSDGTTDMVAVNRDIYPYISLFRNDGAGNLTRIASLATRAYGVAVLDLDGDGRNDLVARIGNTGNPNPIEVRRGLGDGTLGPAETSGGLSSSRFAVDMVTGDFNGDGHADVAECGRIYEGGAWHGSVAVYLNDGAAHFASPYVRTIGGTPGSLVAADFDRDGRLDLAVADGAGPTAWVLWNDGAGAFSGASELTIAEPGYLAAAVAAGDFNRDGHMDLAVTANRFSDGYFSDGTVALAFGNGVRGFTPALQHEFGWGCHRMRAADLDGDGDPDVAFSSSIGHGSRSLSNSIFILWNESPGPPTAIRASLVSAETSIGRASLVWWTDGSVGERITVERAEGAGWMALAQAPVEASGYVRYTDLEANSGRQGYRLRLADGPASGTETWVDVPAANVLAIGAIRPNPGAAGAMTIALSLAGTAPAMLALFDLGGRLVRERSLDLEPGAHVVPLTTGEPLAAGIYFVRVMQDGAIASRRIVVVE